MKYALILLIIIASVSGCHRKSPPPGGPEVVVMDTTNKGVTAVPTAPPCVLRFIDSLKQQPVMNPAAQVDEYEYKGELVYGYSLGCCDFFYEVTNSRCENLCAPSGGFTGKGDGRCPDFYQNAKLVRVVWKDDRGK